MGYTFKDDCHRLYLQSFSSIRLVISEDKNISLSQSEMPYLTEPFPQPIKNIIFYRTFSLANQKHHTLQSVFLSQSEKSYFTFTLLSTVSFFILLNSRLRNMDCLDDAFRCGSDIFLYNAT